MVASLSLNLVHFQAVRFNLLIAVLHNKVKAVPILLALILNLLNVNYIISVNAFSFVILLVVLISIVLLSQQCSQIC